MIIPATLIFIKKVQFPDFEAERCLLLPQDMAILICFENPGS
jgi:hypothetical protein